MSLYLLEDIVDQLLVIAARLLELLQLAVDLGSVGVPEGVVLLFEV